MKLFVVVDANSVYTELDGTTGYSSSIEISAGRPAEACAKAREAGFSGLLFAAPKNGEE